MLQRAARLGYEVTRNKHTHSYILLAVGPENGVNLVLMNFCYDADLSLGHLNMYLHFAILL